ncbi:hypothetical protein FSP39_006874 [Pinctada imbricata]|uniref:Uncharacterized protein n=1 Tax=Pinctada imbricata TaxID=66713 RepID=A0AA88XCU8_PINIB|nr:hypothetical protein FSP39_006874 [Pinctada imbricata]
MRMVLRLPKMRSAWLEYLRVRGYSLAVEHGLWTLSSDVYNSDMSEYNFYNWILWLYGNAFYSGVDSNYNIGGFYTNSGLNILMNLWKRFITNLKLDQSVWRQYLKWTFNTQSNVNPNTLTWKLMEEIRAVLSNRQYLNSWIDFMHEHNTYIVYTSHGWDLVKGSKINNIASWMYWLFITVGDLDLPAGHTDFGKHGGFSGNTNITFGTWQHNFLQRIFHYSQCCLINYYLSFIKHACPIYNNLTYSIFMHHSLTRPRTLCLPEISRACNNTHIFNYYINHSHTILTFVYRKNVAQSIFQSQSLIEYRSIGQNKTSQFYPYLCLKRFLEFTSFTEDYHGAYTLNGIKTMIILWRNFILRLLKIKLIKWQSLCSLLKDSAIPDDRDKYSALTKQMIDLFASDLFSKYWLEYVQYRNFSFVLRDGAWDIAQNCSRDQNQEWLTWILAQAESDSRNDIRSWNSYGSNVLLRNKRESGITGILRVNCSLDVDFVLDLDSDSATVHIRKFALFEIAFQNLRRRMLIFIVMMLIKEGSKLVLTKPEEVGHTAPDTSIESLDHILGSLSTGHGTNSGSSYYDSAEYHYNNYNNYGGGVTDYTGGLGLWALRDADINGFGSSEELVRKRREAKRSRSKRQASPTKFNYMSLLGNCGSQNPSIDISANERNVRMSLMTQGSGAPTTLEIPIVPSWNKLTLVYDGNKMTGTVENWRGKQRKEAALSGK